MTIIYGDLSIGKSTSLTIGRTNVPLAVRTVATLTTPSVAGCVRSILPRLYCVGGWFGDMSSTKSSGCTFGWCFVHFVLPCNCVRYSTDQRFQNDWCSWRSNSHLLSRFFGTESMFGSGISTKGAPVRKLENCQWTIIVWITRERR